MVADKFPFECSDYDFSAVNEYRNVFICKHHQFSRLRSLYLPNIYYNESFPMILIDFSIREAKLMICYRWTSINTLVFVLFSLTSDINTFIFAFCQNWRKLWRLMIMLYSGWSINLQWKKKNKQLKSSWHVLTTSLGNVRQNVLCVSRNGINLFKFSCIRHVRKGVP